MPRRTTAVALEALRSRAWTSHEALTAAETSEQWEALYPHAEEAFEDFKEGLLEFLATKGVGEVALETYEELEGSFAEMSVERGICQHVEDRFSEALGIPMGLSFDSLLLRAESLRTELEALRNKVNGKYLTERPPAAPVRASSVYEHLVGDEGASDG